MQAPTIRCPDCRSRAVVIAISDRARATCSACGADWVQHGWHPSLGPVPRAVPEHADPGRRSALFAATDLSPFELGLAIVRLLVEERRATLLDYDVTAGGGVVNLRVVLTKEEPAQDRS